MTETRAGASPPVTAFPPMNSTMRRQAPVLPLLALSERPPVPAARLAIGVAAALVCGLLQQQAAWAQGASPLPGSGATQDRTVVPVAPIAPKADNRHIFAALTVTSILGRAGDKQFARLIEEGKPASAQQFAGQLAASCEDGTQAAEWWQASGDMALLTDNAQEAHSAYGQSMRRAPGSLASALAGRAAARQVLMGYSSVVSPVAQAFWATPLPAASPFRAEQLCGLAFLAMETAWSQTAQTLAHTLWREADTAGAAELVLLAQSMGKEFHLYDSLSRCAVFRDHVYWNAADRALDSAFPNGWWQDVPEQAGLSLIGGILEARDLQRRRMLNALSGGYAFTDFEALVRQTQKSQYAAVHQHVEILESAFVALVAGRTAEADGYLRAISQPEAFGCGGEVHECELKYALSKLYSLQGRHAESAEMYRHYASLSVLRVRRTLGVLQRLLHGHVGSAGAALGSDDISARLPARYRKAYYLMVSQITDPNLSGKSVSSMVGVTERALQQAFKRYVGESPMEVIRRLRVERIHATLSNSNASPGLIRAVASRFGIHSRTTLSTAYRKYYQQAPSESLAVQM